MRILAWLSLLQEDHSELCDVDLTVVLLFGAVFGLHFGNCCLGLLLHLLDHHAHPIYLTLPHDQLDSALLFQFLGKGLDRLLDTDVLDVLIFVGVLENGGELFPVITHQKL